MLRKWLLSGLCVVLVFSCACCAKRVEQGALSGSIPDEAVSLVSITESADDSSSVAVVPSEGMNSIVSEVSSVPDAGAPPSEPSSSLSEPSVTPPPAISSNSLDISSQEPSQTVSWNSSPASSEASAVPPGSSNTSSSNSITVTLAIRGVKGAVICDAQSLTVRENSTVFTVLRDYARQTGLEFSYTGGVKSAYVTGIDGLYEFDYGNQSGWLYRVNGDFAAASVSCGSYPVHEGDRIEWLYTTDRGADVGAPRF